MPGLLAAAPALPLDEAGKYVAGAYIVFVVLIVIYVAIMAAKLQRIERELRDLAAHAETRADPGMPGRETEEEAKPGTPGREAAKEPYPGMPGREAEDMPGNDSTQPSPGPDRSLVPSGPGEGPADHADSPRGGGGA